MSNDSVRNISDLQRDLKRSVEIEKLAKDHSDIASDTWTREVARTSFICGARAFKKLIEDDHGR